MVPTIAACSGLSRKCRSHAECHHENDEKEQEDGNEGASRFEKFMALSDKNLM
jgi:hypothetical protein